MIILIIVILLLLSACKDWTDAEDWERSEHNAEIRHQELLEAYEMKAKKSKVTKASRTRAVKDRNGNILVEEVILEGDFDYA